MEAALSASDETISSLLSWGASPDETEAKGDTALMSAIQSKCLTTMNLLAPVTQVNLGGALISLAKHKVELKTEELRQLVERAAEDRETAIKGLLAAAMFGASAMIEIIDQCTNDRQIFEANKHEIWMAAVRSDNEATVSALLPLLPNPPLEEITLAWDRVGARGGQATPP